MENAGVPRQLWPAADVAQTLAAEAKGAIHMFVPALEAFVRVDAARIVDDIGAADKTGVSTPLAYQAIRFRQRESSENKDQRPEPLLSHRKLRATVNSVLRLHFDESHDIEKVTLALTDEVSGIPPAFVEGLEAFASDLRQPHNGTACDDAMMKIIVWRRQTRKLALPSPDGAGVDASVTGGAVVHTALLNGDIALAVYRFTPQFPKTDLFERGCTVALMDACPRGRKCPMAKWVQPDIRSSAVALQRQHEAIEALILVHPDTYAGDAHAEASRPVPTAQWLVSEGSRSNYVAIAEDATHGVHVVSVPDADILPGITLSVVHDLIQEKLRLPLVRRRIAMQEIVGWQQTNGSVGSVPRLIGLAIVSTTMPVLAIHEVVLPASVEACGEANDTAQRLGTAPNERARELLAQLHKFTWVRMMGDADV